jgi:hypothetical protein
MEGWGGGGFKMTEELCRESEKGNIPSLSSEVCNPSAYRRGSPLQASSFDERGSSS